MAKKNTAILSICSILCGIALLNACSDDKDKKDEPQPITPVVTTNDLRPISLQSEDGCLLDSDCVTGAFCFNGQCATQCEKDEDCDGDYVCSPRNGRCITKDFADNMYLTDDDDDLSPSDLSRKRHALTDLNAQDIAEAQASNMVEAIPNFEVLTPPPSQISVNLGQASAKINLTATKNFGDLDYHVRSIERGTTGKVRRAEVSVNEETGLATYTFIVYPRYSSLGEQGTTEHLQIDSAAGTFDLELIPRPLVAGLYEGGNLTERFGIAALPMRFAVKTTPIYPTKFSNIKSMTIYVPSSQADLFSPESVTDDKTVWSSIVMKKESAKKCQSQTACWSAAFSTNDYEMAGSQLIDKSQKINRSIRIEIDDFDAQEPMLMGYIKDDISGIYRDYDTTTGQKHWATSSMSGRFNVRRTEAFDSESNTIKEHEIATDTIYRDLEDTSQIACTDEDIAMLMASITGEDEALAECPNILTLEGWLASDKKYECLSAGAANILNDENLTSKIITQLVARNEDDTTAVAGFATLNDFLDNCLLNDSDSKKTVCKTRPEVSCAADLAAYSFLNVDSDQAKEQFMNQFHGLLRESYLGQQYAAWQQDITARQKWLDTADAPKFAAKDIENAVMGILDDWDNNTLQAHLKVMGKQFGQLPLEVLSNQTTKTDEITAERYTILADYQQAWQAVSDAISVAARRYNELLNKTIDRTDKAAMMNPRMFDLYLAGLIESEINRNTNNTSLNGGYANSFNDNMSTLKKLNQSFDALVYMRDAEVTVSNSLNKDDTNVLARRAEKAAKTLEEVTAKRDKVFKDHRDMQISQKTTSANLTNSLENLVTEIVNICGLPEACKVTDVAKIMTKPECDPITTPFYCGFALNKDSLPGRADRDIPADSAAYSVKIKDDGTLQFLDKDGKEIARDDKTFDGLDPQSNVNTGEAAEAILNYRKSLQHVEVAKADLQALQNKVTIARQTCESYAANIKKWYKNRSTYLNNVKDNLKAIESAQDAKAKALIDKLDAQYKSLNDAYTKAQGKLEDWKNIQTNALNEKKEYISDMAEYERAILGVTATSDMIGKALNVGSSIAEVTARAVDAKPLAKGAYSDAIVCKYLDLLQYEVFKIASTGLTGAKNYKKYQQDLKDAQTQYDQKIADKEASIAAQKAEAELVKTLNEFEKTAIGADKTTEKAKAAIEKLREEFNAQDTHERDLQTLENMRSEYLMLAQDMLSKSAVVTESEIEADTALLHYLTLTQRAQMFKSQYDASTERLAQINNLYTAPAVLFTYASDLESVENRIELAKERIYDYLAAIEYNAVRPFVDIRRAVYIARSPNDLKAILDQLDDVIDNCGGVTNTIDDEHAIIVSMREMLGITADFQKMTMQQRFHYALSNGNVPVKSLTRYTVDTTGKQLLNSGHALKSGTFALTIPSFANLQATCNAKIAGFAFKLVGENLIKPDAGTQVHPTITMFYNGKATLASCQPDIESIANTLGHATAYDTYTTFNIEQTKISPNLGLNEWGNSDNTLANYPLASTYTVLIDPEIGENAKINWDNVEDIQIKVLYTYENVKTNNTCKY
ncbi:MAG: hypothetical protein J6A01_12035 [Proteobacteria bacterium]|nr:hypothetical protein [Pseudomonadota bacterium]